MGQQLSSESYCLTTVHKLIAELNTTDSQVSECHVTASSAESHHCNADEAGGGNAGDSGCACRIAFPWREWSRVSKYLERVLPNSEQKRLLTHVLLDQTGLAACSFADRPDTEDDAEVYGFSVDKVGTDEGPRPTAASVWSVHLNYGDETDKNAILYRDFVKLHFQLDKIANNAEQALDSQSGAMGQHPAQQPASNGLSVESSYDSGLSSLSSAGTIGSELADRLAEQLRLSCQRIGVVLVVTKAAYHARDACVVISCTIDVKSILRNSGCLELRSRVNPDVEEAEIGDQLQRSLSGLRDKFTGHNGNSQQQQQQHDVLQQPYFPMLLYFCASSHRVILIYGRELRGGGGSSGGGGWQ